MKTKSKSLRKISSVKGFSMAETLMTVLLMSISLLVITGGASVVQRSYNTITMKADAMALISTLTTAMNADLRSARDIQEDHKTFYSGQRKLMMKFDAESGTDEGNAYSRIVIKYGTEDKTLIVGSEGMYNHGKLSASFLTEENENKPPTFSEAGKYFTYTIVVRRSSDNKVLESQDVCVHVN